MDSRKDKQSLELEYAKMLCEHVPWLTNAQLSSLQPPEPDILAEAGGKRIGIEVTEIHGDPRLRMIEGEHEKLLLRAQELWNSRSLPPVAVWIHWIPSRLVRRLPRDLAAKLVEFLADRLPDRPASIELDHPEIHAAIGSDCGIEHIFLYTDWEDPTVFEQGQRWVGGTASPQLIQRELDRKNRKPSKYSGGYASRCLLLVHNGGNPSSGFDIGDSVVRAVYQSTFNEVWILSLIGPKVRTLRLAS